MNDLVIGQWNVICDQCGVKRKSSQVTQRWDGLIVCKSEVRPGCFEHRHPQDFVRTVKEDTSVPFVRSEPTDIFVDVTFNCNTADFVWRDKSMYSVNESRMVYKDKVQGPVIFNGITIIVCELNIL